MIRLAFLGLLLAGCNKNNTVDPCAGINEVCVVARVEGNVTNLDQLIFSVESPTHQTTKSPNNPQPGSVILPVRVAVVMPAGANFPLELTVFGISGNVAVAQDKKQIALAGNRANVTFVLNSGTAPDLSVPADLAQLPDLSKPPITLTSDVPDGGLEVYELERVTVKITASDPLNESLTLQFRNGPDGGTLTSPVVNQLQLEWVPSIFDSQIYPMHGDAVSNVDNTRMATVPTPLRVRNAFDPVFRLNPNDMVTNNQSPTHVIGDFDGDGFADLASCGVGPNNPNGAYNVFVLYADAKGLPPMLPALGMPNYRRYSFMGTSPSMPSERLVCAGGDFDGDGKSDIMVGDPNATAHGMLYLILGDANRAGNGIVIQVLDNSAWPPSEVIGNNQIFVGDFNGDNLADFVTQTVPAAGIDNTYVFSWKAIAPVAGMPINKASPPTLLFAGASLTGARHAAPAGHFCQPRFVQGFGNIDSAPGDEILLSDSGVAVTVATDCNMPGKGGVTLIKDGAADSSYVRPTVSEPSYGQSSALCDVDGDNLADLVVADGPNNSHVYVQFNAAGVFANTGGAPGPLVLDGVAGPNVVVIPPNPVGHTWAGVGCARSMSNGAVSIALIDPGDNVSVPTRIDIFSSGRMPMFLFTVPNPTSPADIQFGTVNGGSGDINGDGLRDTVVGSKNGLFAVYGR